MPDETLSRRLDEMEAITREYARFSRSAGGLAWVLGGLTALAAYLAGGLLPPTPLLVSTLVALPGIWIAAKELLARGYYQRMGRVEEQVAPAERRWQRILTGYTVLVALFILLRVATSGQPWTAATWGYVALVAAMPLVVWLWLRTPMEFVVGVFLICQGAVAVAGRAYPLWSVAAVFPLAALLMIAAGIRDHLRYRALQGRLRALAGGAHE
jgi:hypothetical protein